MESWGKRLLFPLEPLIMLRASKWLLPPPVKPLWGVVTYSLVLVSFFQACCFFFWPVAFLKKLFFGVVWDRPESMHAQVDFYPAVLQV